MFILQVPPTLLKNTSAVQTLYRTLSLHIYVRGKIYLDSDIEKPGSSAHFLIATPIVKKT